MGLSLREALGQTVLVLLNQEPLTHFGGGREEWMGDGGSGRLLVEQLEHLVV